MGHLFYDCWLIQSDYYIIIILPHAYNNDDEAGRKKIIEATVMKLVEMVKT